MRDLEAEGFFVSDGIDRTNWNLNKMERRLAMAERGSK